METTGEKYDDVNLQESAPPVSETPSGALDPYINDLENQDDEDIVEEAEAKEFDIENPEQEEEEQKET